MPCPRKQGQNLNLCLFGLWSSAYVRAIQPTEARTFLGSPQNRIPGPVSQKVIPRIQGWGHPKLSAITPCWICCPQGGDRVRPETAASPHSCCFPGSHPSFLDLLHLASSQLPPQPACAQQGCPGTSDDEWPRSACRQQRVHQEGDRRSHLEGRVGRKEINKGE